MRSATILPFSLWSFINWPFINKSSRLLMACLACSMRCLNLTRLGSNNATSKRSRQSPVLVVGMVYRLRRRARDHLSEGVGSEQNTKVFYRGVSLRTTSEGKFEVTPVGISGRRAEGGGGDFVAMIFVAPSAAVARAGRPHDSRRDGGSTVYFRAF